MREITPSSELPEQRKPFYVKYWPIFVIVVVVLSALSLTVVFENKATVPPEALKLDPRYEPIDPKRMTGEEVLRRAGVGNVFAQAYLAGCYRDGTGGFPKDDALRFQWALKAAKQGHVWSQNEAGFCYFYGLGTKRDYVSALGMFRGAAMDSGDPFAQLHMGLLNNGVHGFPRDDEVAAEWFRKSAMQGNAFGAANYGRHLLLGHGVPKAPDQAIDYLKKGVGGGSSDAAYLLGWAYANGEGVDKDLKEAIRLFRLAIIRGSYSATSYLAYLYLNGNGVIKDAEEAARLYKIAADAGDIEAKKRLGSLYHDGKGVAVDLKKASELYLEVAISGDVECQRVMGIRYQQGLGVPADYVEAYAWYNVCAASGDELAAKSRESLAQNLQADQVAAAQKRSRELLKEIEAKKAKK
jgi:TPR repeat protein